MLAGCVVFVSAGIWFILKPHSGKMFLAGLASILFFGLIAFYIVKKLTDKSPGLTISNEGVFDNASAVSAGFIPWADVLEISETRVVNQSFINIIVKNPQEYIDRQTNAFKRKVAQINYNSYGTVIGISANGLKCNYPELKAALQERFSLHKNKVNT